MHHSGTVVGQSLMKLFDMSVMFISTKQCHTINTVNTFHSGYIKKAFVNIGQDQPQGEAVN